MSINLVWSPFWTPERMRQATPLDVLSLDRAEASVLAQVVNRRSDGIPGTETTASPYSRQVLFTAELSFTRAAGRRKR